MSTLTFGTIRAYDPGTHTATVQVTGYMTTVVEDVPVADNIASGVMLAGARCAVACVDPFNVVDMCVVAVW